MRDMIWGTVTNILDGNTFEINVTHREKNNKERYQDTESIKIEKIEVPQIPRNIADRSKDKLESYLRGKFVLCKIYQRSADGYLLAEVSLSGIGGY
ncbi:MAG: hypothetical protein ACE5KA_01535 [Nitrososphaerales archaeon]